MFLNAFKYTSEPFKVDSSNQMQRSWFWTMKG